MTGTTSEIVADLTGILAPADQYANKVLTDAERYGSSGPEFIVRQYVTWNNGTETVDMTVLVAGQQPTPGSFNLCVDIIGNGSEVFHFLYEERIIGWILGMLSANGWESIPSEHSDQQARVDWGDGFVFFVRRPEASQG